MDAKDLNLDEWVLYNPETTEMLSIDILQVNDGGNFNKVFISELADMIGCAGSSSEKVLSWMLKNKNNKNEFYGTHRSISEEIKVSLPTVTRVFKALNKGGYLRMIRQGAYILNPKVLHYGGIGNRIAIVKVWDGCK